MMRWTKAARVPKPRAGDQVRRDSLDGFYRHRGCATDWDDGGVTLTRNGRVTRLAWEDILGVRQFGHPGYVQLIVKGHIPSQRHSEDHYTIPVNSDPDANRLITTLGWHARGRDLTTHTLA